MGPAVGFAVVVVLPGSEVEPELKKIKYRRSRIREGGEIGQ